MISSRGTKRDFVDIYFIAKKYGFDQIIMWYKQKYGNLDERRLMLKKALVFFQEAENDETPHMLLPCSWEEIKEYFIQQVSKF